jgi:hypothetical protein
MSKILSCRGLVEWVAQLRSGGVATTSSRQLGIVGSYGLRVELLA